MKKITRKTCRLETKLIFVLQAQNPLEPSLEKLIESLKIFDRLFADFELCYVGAMVPVKSTKEYEQQELVCVLFSETLQRALEAGLLSQADVDNYEPALMFTIPRLAIVSGLLAPPGGPLCLNSPDNISEMFRPFRVSSRQETPSIIIPNKKTQKKKKNNRGPIPHLHFS